MQHVDKLRSYLLRPLYLFAVGAFALALLAGCDSNDSSDNGEDNSATFEASLTGAAEVPNAVFTQGSGQVDLEINEAGDAIDYTVRLADIDGVTQGHIHIGDQGTNGPVAVLLFQFTENVDGTGSGETQSFTGLTAAAEGTITADDVSALADIGFDGSLQALIDAIEGGGAYVNVHSTAFPAGEVRGQIDVDEQPTFARTITPVLSGDSEVPPVETDASGSATLEINDAGDALDYTVSLANIDGVSQAHIHIGGPDENGPVVAFLFQFTENVDGTGSGETQAFTSEAVAAEGTITADDVIALPEAGFDGSIEAFLNAVTRGEAYINVHSADVPSGEVRGQTVDGSTDGGGASAPADVTITVDNVGASAWRVTSVNGASGVADTDTDNPAFTLTTGTRYRIDSGGGEAHPFAFQDADLNFLLTQDFSTEAGSFEDDADVAFISDDDGITFTLTEALADEIARYLCTIHRTSMNGTVSVSSP